MDTICRLCSTQSTSLTSAFNLKNNRIIADMILIICPIRIDISDQLPQYICTSCINIVYDAVDLREKSIQSDQNFKSGSFPFQSVEQIKIKVEKDPFHHELWLDDETNNYASDNSNENASNDDKDEDYYPEMMLEIQSKNLGCSKCPKTFANDKNLQQHIQQCHKVVTYKSKSKTSCHLCGLKLAHASNVKRHMQRYHDESLPYSCDQCTCRFKSEVRLNTHIEKTHDCMQKTEKYEEPAVNPVKHESILCDLCGKNFPSRTLLERHLTMSHRPKDTFITNEDDPNFTTGCYPCSLCPKTFTMRHNLNRHCKRFHSADLKYDCAQCNDRFKSDVHLKRHVLRVHENHKGMFNRIAEISEPKGEEMHEKCQYCDQEFNGSKYRYERHMILMHEKELLKTYSCDICAKKFVFLKSLKYHVEVHRKRVREENFPFQCTICLRKFLSEEKFKHHNIYSHTETSSLVCYLCGKTLDSRKKLNYHLLRHQDIRNYQCTKCGMKFIQARHLDRHLTTHSDVRPYVCSFSGCGKAFKMSDVLKKHLRRVHHADGSRNEMKVDNCDGNGQNEYGDVQVEGFESNLMIRGDEYV